MQLTVFILITRFPYLSEHLIGSNEDGRQVHEIEGVRSDVENSQLQDEYQEHEENDGIQRAGLEAFNESIIKSFCEDSEQGNDISLDKDMGTIFDAGSDVISDSSDLDETSDSSDSAESDTTSENFSGDEETHSEKEDRHLKQDMLPKSSIQSLAVLAYLSKYNCTGNSVDDLIKLIEFIHPEATQLPGTYKKLLDTIPSIQPSVYHYCQECFNVFPVDNLDHYLCSTEGCNGFRYEGAENLQGKSTRKARAVFTIGDIGKQIEDLLSRPQLWAAIECTKRRLREDSETNDLKDITDGEGYQRLTHKGGFLDPMKPNISFCFNTDGIPLFSSSGVKLWPIFLAVNELPPAVRYCRENIILAGLWQGNTKPPFLQYLSALGRHLHRLYIEGVNVTCARGNFCCKAAVLVGCMDLQAKAYVLDMTMHNGQYGCISCEEPGITVRQGKGTSRCYPYHPQDERPIARQSSDIVENKAPVATRRHRIKGICGISRVEQFPIFDCVIGMVPDYMHGVLLGVTKSLLYKWLSSTHSSKPYFIGKQVKEISKRLQKIKPPDYVERLPRDLEKHYNNLKATELQAWLLHYSIPCLHGILPDKYLEHFALLSEGIHILLRSCIDTEDLKRAEEVLDLFYKEYSTLYGEGSCGLNVHNIGCHLAYYVKQWGPLFGWHCFGFEDYNARILDYAHGTGDVTSQILRRQNACRYLSAVDMDCAGESDASFIKQMIASSNKRAKVTRKTINCGKK